VAHQHFKPGTDPRERDANDPGVLTAIGRDFDAVFVADEAFDFARTVSYRMSRPRPVIGSIDLEPTAWHWTWERHGAPQVNSRCAKRSGGRHMDGPDWAAWLAVKMIVRAYILGDNGFDCAKGLRSACGPGTINCARRCCSPHLTRLSPTRRSRAFCMARTRSTRSATTSRKRPAVWESDNVIARGEATKQSGGAAGDWVASLSLAMTSKLGPRPCLSVTCCVRCAPSPRANC
jgi:hypothetical protein